MVSRKPRAVLFDLDGTLIDTVELILASYRHTCQVHALHGVPDHIWAQSLGTPLRVQFARFASGPEHVQDMIATYLEHNMKHHDSLVREYPGVLEAVRGLSTSGLRLAVVTSKMHGGLERGLSVGGYDGLFELLIGADDVENPKPHPEPVLKALSGLGVEPAEAVFVGDSPYDMASGRAAGVRTAVATWGPFSREALEPHKPDFWLESPAAILKLVEN